LWMCFAESFAISIPRMNAINVDKIIVRIIIERSREEIVFNKDFIATAVPERALFIAYRATKFRAVTIVLMEPIKKRKDLESVSVISEAITAACPEPMPGRKEQRGAEIADARELFRNCFFVNFIFFIGEIFCFGNLEEDEDRLIINVDEPKRPVSKGRRGSLTGRLNVIRPRKPARVKITKEDRGDFSLNIR